MFLPFKLVLSHIKQETRSAVCKIRQRTMIDERVGLVRLKHTFVLQIYTSLFSFLISTNES